MREFDKLCKHIDNELHKIEEKGLNQGNLDTAYKLVDMYKDMAKAEYYKMQTEAMDESYGYQDEYSGGYSGGRGRGYGMGGGRDGYGAESSYARGGRRRHRDSMGRFAGNYPRAYDGYQQAKNEYRQSKSGDCKSNVLDMLNQYMEEIMDELSDVARNADCQEERQEISKYLDKMRGMIA